MRLRDVLRVAQERLAAAGIERADFDALLLVEHATGWDRAEALSRMNETVDPPSLARLADAVARREKREPLQYITGRQAFWKGDFLVTPAVLIPRPETEILVARAVSLLEAVPQPNVLDVGTGSGCIAISIALERPDATVHATDISAAALAVAAQNARLMGASVRFHETDLVTGVERGATGFHVIVSNPPYVEPADRAGLMPEVRDHEPDLALFPPGDGLHFYRRLAIEAGPLLAGNGALAVEVGAGQAEAVSDLLKVAGYDDIACDDDLQGLPRVVHVRRR